MYPLQAGAREDAVARSEARSEDVDEAVVEDRDVRTGNGELVAHPIRISPGVQCSAEVNGSLIPSLERGKRVFPHTADRIQEAEST